MEVLFILHQSPVLGILLFKAPLLPIQIRNEVLLGLDLPFERLEFLLFLEKVVSSK
jgi:hypothetical protein